MSEKIWMRKKGAVYFQVLITQWTYLEGITELKRKTQREFEKSSKNNEIEFLIHLLMSTGTEKL